jgi:hypothetical protein
MEIRCPSGHKSYGLIPWHNQSIDNDHAPLNGFLAKTMYILTFSPPCQTVVMAVTIIKVLKKTGLVSFAKNPHLQHYCGWNYRTKGFDVQ